MASYPKPIVAAVEGAAAGAGFALALACDSLVAASDARFVMSHAKLGLSPDGGATARLAEALPPALVKRLLWLAEPVSSATLSEHGLVAIVSLPGSALADALILADRLAALAPGAVASVKELVAQRRGAPSSSSSPPSATTSSSTCSAPTAARACGRSSRSARRAFPDLPRRTLSPQGPAVHPPVLTIDEQSNIESGSWFSRLSPPLREAILARAQVRRVDDGACSRRAAPRPRSGAASPRSRCG
jgi:hypothetical protein